MYLKKMLGLDDSEISEEEIMEKIAEARKNNIQDIEIRDTKGGIIKIHTASMTFDEELMDSPDTW